MQPVLLLYGEDIFARFLIDYPVESGRCVAISSEVGLVITIHESPMLSEMGKCFRISQISD